MPTPFDTLTVRDIQQRLAGTVPDAARTARLYASGDHWQGAAGWMGPRPASTEAGAAETLAEIQRAFISKNAVAEVLNRHIAGVVGQPVPWRLTVARPLLADEETTDAEQALIAEAEAALTAWWDEGGIASELQAALETLLCVGRSPLRLFVPSGLLVDGRLPAGDLSTQLSRIVLESPDPAVATVLTDPATRQRAGVLLYEADKQALAEVSAVDGDETVLRIVSGDSVQSEVRMPLGGRLLLFDLTRNALITEQVQALQRLLNLALTMLGRNVVLGGFLERVLLNAQLPGTWAKDAAGRDVFTPEPLRFGAGSVTALMGAEVRDERTGELSGYANPSVVYRDPVPVDSFERTKGIAYQAILEEVQQQHATIAGAFSISGESRIQARADFLTSLALTAPTVERGVRWLLETALHLAAYFAGQPGRYLGLRAVATCKLSVGPITADELTQVISLVDARLLSRESGMQRIGIDDTDAEMARIQSESTVSDTVIGSFNSGV